MENISLMPFDKYAYEHLDVTHYWSDAVYDLLKEADESVQATDKGYYGFVFESYDSDSDEFKSYYPFLYEEKKSSGEYYDRIKTSLVFSENRTKAKWTYKESEYPGESKYSSINLEAQVEFSCKTLNYPAIPVDLFIKYPVKDMKDPNMKKIQEFYDNNYAVLNNQKDQ